LLFKKPCSVSQGTGLFFFTVSATIQLFFDIFTRQVMKKAKNIFWVSPQGITSLSEPGFQLLVQVDGLTRVKDSQQGKNFSRSLKNINPDSTTLKSKGFSLSEPRQCFTDPVEPLLLLPDFKAPLWLSAVFLLILPSLYFLAPVNANLVLEILLIAAFLIALLPAGFSINRFLKAYIYRQKLQKNIANQNWLAVISELKKVFYISGDHFRDWALLSAYQKLMPIVCADLKISEPEKEVIDEFGALLKPDDKSFLDRYFYNEMVGCFVKDSFLDSVEEDFCLKMIQTLNLEKESISQAGRVLDFYSEIAQMLKEPLQEIECDLPLNEKCFYKTDCVRYKKMFLKSGWRSVDKGQVYLTPNRILLQGSDTLVVALDQIIKMRLLPENHFLFIYRLGHLTPIILSGRDDLRLLTTIQRLRGDL
jgi:hypothetical protein